MKLNPVPSKAWQQKYDKLMKDPYLSKKYNRDRRIKDKRKYITELCPEVKAVKGKRILDIGPGPGEFLELCRSFGHEVSGIDAPINDCEMGNEYIQLSKLMTERQKITVDYSGLLDFVLYPFVFHPTGEKTNVYAKIGDNSIFLINAQGSLEQCFKDYMKGPRHRDTKDASLLSWTIGFNLKSRFHKMFAEFYRKLEPGGYVLIYGNGAKNVGAYDKLITETASKFDFKLVMKKGHRLHKWWKTHK